MYIAVQQLSMLEDKLAYYEKAFKKQRERVLTIEPSLRNNVPEARVVSSAVRSDDKGRSRDKMMEEP